MCRLDLTQLGTFQSTAITGGIAPSVSGEAGVIIGGIPIGLGTSTENPVPKVVTEVKSPAVAYAGLKGSTPTKPEDQSTKGAFHTF